jgi:uncharacterized protein
VPAAKFAVRDADSSPRVGGVGSRQLDGPARAVDTRTVSVEPGTELDLADWRRQVSDLYAEVRRLSEGDPDAALTIWRNERERLYRDHPMSPVPEKDRASFRARHFPTDPSLRFEVTVRPDDPAVGTGVTPLALAPEAGPAAPMPLSAPLSLPNSGADTLSFRRIGSIEIPFPDRPRTLSLFWMEGYAGGLFLPFRDATSGHETYAAGRYLLDSAKSADLGGSADRRTIVIDFNFAYQPSCAFDPRWACPLAPPENRLDLPIRAGERSA